MVVLQPLLRPIADSFLPLNRNLDWNTVAFLFVCRGTVFLWYLFADRLRVVPGVVITVFFVGGLAVWDLNLLAFLLVVSLVFSLVLLPLLLALLDVLYVLSETVFLFAHMVVGLFGGAHLLWHLLTVGHLDGCAVLLGY